MNSFPCVILGISGNSVLPFCDLFWAVSGGKIVRWWPSQEFNILSVIYLFIYYFGSFLFFFFFFKVKYRDFPGGPVVKYPPFNAGDAGLIPGQGTKIPRAAGQLSPHATTTELEHLNWRAHVPQTTEPMSYN